MSKLNNKIAVITGGSTGIGLATAQRFIADGAEVVITGRNQEALDSAVVKLGDRATGIRGDVANLEDLDRLFATSPRIPVAPGVVRTPIYGDADVDAFGGVALMNRVGEAQEITEAVIHLATASFTTGVILPVDGGYVHGRA